MNGTGPHAAPARSRAELRSPPLKNTPLWSAHKITERLQAVEEDLAARIPAYEAAAQEYYSLRRDVELEEAKAFVLADGPVEERKMKARKHLEGMSLWERAKLAEGTYHAKKAAIGSLESRSVILMSLLRTQREAA